MNPFRRKAQPSRADQQAAATATAIRELSERFERIERAIRDLKQNVDLVPSLVRKLYLEGVALEPPYDLQSERFSFSSQNDEDGLVLAIFKRIGATRRRFVDLGCGMNGGNSGFLASELGWHGLMVDGRDDAIRKIVVRFTGHPVIARHQLLTREGINAFITHHLQNEIAFFLRGAAASGAKPACGPLSEPRDKKLRLAGDSRP